MKQFSVIYLKGSAAFRGNTVEFVPQPGRHQLEVTAADPIEAYKKAHQHFTSLGLRVSIDLATDGSGNRLRFSDEEVAAIRKSGTEFTTESTSGVRLQTIVPSI